MAKKGFNSGVSFSKSGSNSVSKFKNVGTYIVAGLYNLIIWTGITFAAILLLIGVSYIGVLLGSTLLGAFGFTMIDFITIFSAVIIGVFIAGVMIFVYTTILKFIIKKVTSKMWHIEKKDGKAVLVKGNKEPVVK